MVFLNLKQLETIAKFLERVLDPANILDRNLIILAANRARADKHLRSLNEIIGQPCYMMFQRRQTPCTDCPVQEAFETRQPALREKYVDLPDGQRRYGEVQAFPLFNAHGRISHVLEVARDITNKRQAWRQLQKINMIDQKKFIRILNRLFYPPDEHECDFKLTVREREILTLVARGMTNAEVATTLNLSPHTIKTHIDHILNKSGASDRTQVAVWAVKKGLI